MPAPEKRQVGRGKKPAKIETLKQNDRSFTVVNPSPVNAGSDDYGFDPNRDST